MMRLTGGSLKRRTFLAPPGLLTRPTSSLLRQALFNVLLHHPNNPIPNAQILDLFCGSGSLAFEALSRGAQHALLVDSSPHALRVAQNNAQTLQLASQTSFLLKDARLLTPPATPPTLILADPPWRLNPAVALNTAAALAPQHALIALGRSRRAEPPPAHPRLLHLRNVAHGDGVFQLFLAGA